MATTPSQTWTEPRIGAADASKSGFLLRCLLAALAVLVCYQFQWEWLRHLTLECNLRFDAALGVQLERVGFDTVMWNGHLYHYVVACTFADVWCGAIAFLWQLRRTILQNLVALAGFTFSLFVFNIVRLSFSDLLCARGASWNLGHNVISGISYFLIWTWLQRQRVNSQDSDICDTSPA